MVMGFEWAQKDARHVPGALTLSRTLPEGDSFDSK